MIKSLKNIFASVIALVFSFILCSHSALAFTPLEGQLTASVTCPALASIKKGTNPDNLRLQVGQTYTVVGQNKTPATHYLIEIPDTTPSQRWVSTKCGNLASISNVSTSPVIPPGVKIAQDYLLAISWQPAFCETKPAKTECKTLAGDPKRFEATNFALHGLWPQPKGNDYCGVSKSDIDFDKAKNWGSLPAIEGELTPATWAKLQIVMPGTASNLHRHEWIKHGTCYKGTPEEYYSESIALLDAVNSSPVQDLVAENIGDPVTINAIDKALSVFSSNAGEKVEVKCNDSLLGELWINLRGNITPTSSISDLIANSLNAKSEPKSLKSCVIDDVD
jgi:ribonuclease T2